MIGHRGASGYRPEHTLAAYGLAIAQCADFIEPDLVSTGDGVLVARHENEIGGTTDVASHPEFAARRTTKMIDGVSVTGWFAEDFTLAELQTLRARERLPAVRPANTAFDGQFEVPSFQQVIDLARRSRTCDGRPVGIYPETKHPSYFDGIGLSLEEPLVETLRAPTATATGVTRCSSRASRSATCAARPDDRRAAGPAGRLRGAPWDFRVAGDPRTYADLVTPQGLEVRSAATPTGSARARTR